MAGGVCPGDMSKRVWYACMGPEFRAPTAAETVAGITTASEMCCTEEFDFECLCCLDFSVPLQMCAPGQTGFCLSRCGAMDLDAANEPPGSPLSMTDDLNMPTGPTAAPAMAPTATPPAPPIVTVCTKETGVGAMADQQSGNTPVSLPVECITREFTAAEIAGQVPDVMTGAALTPGQVILDERIDFLVAQGMEAPDIPTCTKTYAEKYPGGMCPVGTAKANQYPNSASDSALGRVGAYVSEKEQPAAAAAFVRTETENKKQRRHGRSFRDLAALSQSQIEEVLGEDKTIAFALNGKLTRLKVDKVTSGDNMVLASADGRRVAVSGSKVVFSEGERSEEVDPLTTVITIQLQERMGRRGAFLKTGGSFKMQASSNRGGNT